MIERTARLFDDVVVAVNERTSKNLLFDADERVALLRESLGHLPHVSVECYSGLTVEYAAERGACAIVRGLRATGDFEFEYQLALMNRHLRGEIEGVFLMTSLNYAHISSTLVKEIARLGGSLDGLVPAAVAAALASKFGALGD